MALTAAQKKYVEWLAKKDPFLLSVAIKRATGKTIKPEIIHGELGGFFDSIGSLATSAINAVQKVNFTNLTKTIADTAARLATSKAQVQIINAQTKRAISGQPPIEVAAYQPALQANFNPVTAQGQMAVNTTAQQLNEQSKFNFVSILPWLALGIGGALLIGKLKGK